MSPNSHLRGCGCPKCGIEKILNSPNRYHSWSKTNWRRRCEGKIAKLYIIRIFNDNESFYKKIGSIKLTIFMSNSRSFI